MARKVKELTAEERSAIEKLARSRTASARAVERAHIIRLATSSPFAVQNVQKLNFRGA